MGVNNEIEGVDAGFKHAVTELFETFYVATSEQSKWSDNAIERFRKGLAHARIARDAVLKVIEESP